jgi:hypothetical protein
VSHYYWHRGLSEILDAASKELQSFLLLDKTSRLVYRPTSLDSLSVLQSLVAHIKKDDDTLLPVARQGAGMISLQAFLLLLAFAEQRRRLGRNFILVAEEPELHLHPSLHHRLVNRIRAASTQSIVTTQSPIVAAGYQPSEVIFIRNSSGNMTATRLRTGSVKQIPTNSVRKLYLAHRSAFYEALMGGVIVVPEGTYDFEWLSLLQRLAQSSQDQSSVYNLRPITIVPTQDSLVETYGEIVRFRPDAIPLIDGDEAGEMYLTTLRGRTPTPPRKIIRYGPGAAIECLAAWILEPALATPGDALEGLQSKTGCKSLKELQVALFSEKKEREFRENVVWESIVNAECCRRACEFFHDLAAIAFDESPLNCQWSTTIHPENVIVFTAGHIGRV